MENTILYVAYWVDLDDDCLKKSEIKILGVYTDEDKARKACNRYHHKGYCEDHRCYYTRYEAFELDKPVPRYKKNSEE